MCNLLKFLKNSQIKTVQVLHLEDLGWVTSWTLQDRSWTLINIYQSLRDQTKSLIENGREIWVCAEKFYSIVNSLIPTEFKKFVIEAVSRSEKIFDKKRRWDQSYSWIREIVPRVNHIIKQDLSWYNYI